MRSEIVPAALILLAAGAAATAACSRPLALGDPLRGLSAAERSQFDRGRAVFDQVFSAETGLGPLFNGTACVTCHGQPVSGGDGPISEIHASVFQPGGFCDPLVEKGGPVYQQQFTQALRDALGISSEPIPPEAARATRTTPDVFGFGLLDAVPNSTILAMADPDDADGDGISGRVNLFFDGRPGRFGRKALIPTLAEFNEGAFPIEQGVTVPNSQSEGTVGGTAIPPGVDPLPEPELNADLVAVTDAFVRFLAPPEPAKLTSEAKRGERLFVEIGCAKCHVPMLKTGDHPVDALANKEFAAFTDLLLHDMGPDLADICLGLVAEPSEFRTEPLIGLRFAGRFLHDGRANTVEEAIEFHGGESAASRNAFRALSQSDRQAVLAYLGSL